MLKTKITAIAASAGLVLSLLAPATFASTIKISGNGSDSTNTAKVKNTNNTTVNQTNSTVVGVNITSKANTGGNKANGNTGGNVTVSSGAAVSTVGVGVTGSSNTLEMADCGCPPADDDITISNNGEDSTNKANVKNKNKKTTSQVNGSVVGIGITSKAKTGKNKANDNTGGDVEVTSDDATSEVGVGVDAPSNTITP